MTPHRARCAVLALALLAACGGDVAGTGPRGPGAGSSPAPTGPTGALVAGQEVTDRAGYVSYVPGDAPLIIVAAHGGTLLPAALPDRTCTGCVTVSDLSTQELARAIADSFAVRTGQRPHVVVNLLHRRKFDANRDLSEATGGTRALDTTWMWFHAAIDTARQRIQRRHGRGLVVDMHGHGHDIQRLELGYLLSATTLRQSDAALETSRALNTSSVASIAGTSRSTAERDVRLLRGATSLGNIMIARGYRAVPSSTEPAPLLGEEYFSGGYITERHGSSAGGTVDAIQMECHFEGVRESAAARARFAGALSDGLQLFFDRHYGWTGST